MKQEKRKFTLHLLPAAVACRTDVLLRFKKSNQMPYDACRASASCIGGALTRSAFTLIELLVVIAIIAILSRSKNLFFLLFSAI